LPNRLACASDAEFLSVGTYLDATGECANQVGLYRSGGKMKETGTGHWASPNTGATTAVVFHRASGWLHLQFRVRFLITDAYFGCYENTTVAAWYRVQIINSAKGYRYSGDKNAGFSSVLQELRIIIYGKAMCRLGHSYFHHFCCLI